MQPTLTKQSPSGKYCLNKTAWVLLQRGEFVTTTAEVDEVMKFMSDDIQVPRTVNSFDATKFNKRKQCAYVTPGVHYDFSNQKNRNFQIEPDNWPDMVKRALDLAKEFAVAEGLDPNLYRGVQLNYYHAGTCGITPHADDETQLVAGMPIISLTLLAGSKVPRSFQIYKKPKPGAKLTNQDIVAEVDLNHGDVLVMGGTMQKSYFHGIKTSTSKKFQDARRLNLTVRAFVNPTPPMPPTKRKFDEMSEREMWGEIKHTLPLS
jgi:alkylated DNA repair dioxygenase AlkB